MRLTDSIRQIKGVGEKAEKTFGRLGIYNIEQLLTHYPKGYDVYEPWMPIAQINEGSLVSIEASLTARAQIKQVRNLKITSCQVRDASGCLVLTWFNMPFLQKTLRLGVKYIFRGKVVVKHGILAMEQPQILTKQEFFNRLHILQPIYPLTDGLSNHAVTKAVAQAMKEIEWSTDHLPLEIRKKNNLVDFKSAVREIHFPKNKETMMSARKRLVFDEFFLFTLALNQLKKQKILKKSSVVLKSGKLCHTLIRSLPYDLTSAQKKSWYEIEMDLSGGVVMNRLVQGDVGSGKTIIAALALLKAAENGYQGAIMVPTEVLAKQHQETFEALFKGLGIQVGLLTGSMTIVKKRNAYEKIKNGEIQIIVGTHALIQEKCEYAKLGLVITDEQHRFGVKQREALSSKGIDCHTLVMSATPIPRTLAIILYGDMDVSVIDELPANRLPIKNCVIDPRNRNTAYKFIEKEVQKGRQAYVICPMVDENEDLELENVIAYTEQLKNVFPPNIVIDYLYGKMKSKEKNERMERFALGSIQVLVSTTVIEVGINVTNATVMMIENAERFGLAQLHQLRGRVGRGNHQSYCILVRGSESKEAKKRLEVLNQSNDGFFIAARDLELRGPGDLFGIRQSGLLEFKLGDIYQDTAVLKAANDSAKELADKDAMLLLKKHNKLLEKMSVYTEEVRL